MERCTIYRLKSALASILAQAGFLASADSEELQWVFLDPDVERAMRANGDAELLFAFDGTTVM